MLLQETNYNMYLNLCGDFIINLIGKEVSGYLKGVYLAGDGRREPENYNFLPVHSIVRALGNYVKQNVCINSHSLTSILTFNISGPFLAKYKTDLFGSVAYFKSEIFKTTAAFRLVFFARAGALS